MYFYNLGDHHLDLNNLSEAKEAFLNELTIGNYPRKIDEYLAMGKPTVATPTRAMEIFKDHVYLAEGAKGYEQAIAEGLASIGNQEVYEERIRFAQSHS